MVMKMNEATSTISILKPVEDVFGLGGRVLRVLLEYPSKEFTKKELIECAGVSSTFFQRYYETLKKQKFIIVTKTVGRVEFFKPNLDNEILRLMENWYLVKKKEMELVKARQIYEREYKGKETKEDKALVKLFEHYELYGNLDVELPSEVERNLEKQLKIVVKGSKKYFTQDGYEIARAMLKFDKEVLMAGA
ncbi:MAG: hypothetical protein Q7T16_04960 [Candidatus Burarchaeum sp.]|nr:hypothetical protein [Candidatus Burarchaeum sp.]